MKNPGKLSIYQNTQHIKKNIYRKKIHFNDVSIFEIIQHPTIHLTYM